MRKTAKPISTLIIAASAFTAAAVALPAAAQEASKKQTLQDFLTGMSTNDFTAHFSQARFPSMLGSSNNSNCARIVVPEQFRLDLPEDVGSIRFEMCFKPVPKSLVCPKGQNGQTAIITAQTFSGRNVGSASRDGCVIKRQPGP